MMSIVERIKYYYDKGLYTKEHLDVLLSKNAITEEDYNSILGIEIPGENNTESETEEPQNNTVTEE